jgi:hypothetical protein
MSEAAVRTDDAARPAATAAPATSPARPSVSRVVAADAASQVERLESSPLVAEGRVNLIGLDSIQARLDSRWGGKRDQVHEYVQRLLETRLDGSGWWVKVSETDYLVVQPTLDRHLAQASCVRFMREILGHFLGEARPTDVAVREVTYLDRAGLKAALVDRAMASAAHDHDDDDETAGRSLKAALPTSERSDVESQGAMQWSPFVAGDGRELRVSCNLEPVFELNTFQMIGFRLNRRVIVAETDEVLSVEKVQRLSTADIERVDLATIARGLSRLRSDTANRPMMVMMPIFYPTLAAARGRANLIPCLRETREGMGSRVICEVESADELAINALLSVGDLIRPFCHALIGRLSGEPDRRLSGLKEASLNGVSFTFSPHGYPNADAAAGALARLIEYAKRAGRNVMVRGPFTQHDLVLAQVAGATHAVMAAPGR